MTRVADVKKGSSLCIRANSDNFVIKLPKLCLVYIRLWFLSCAFENNVVILNKNKWGFY